MRIHRQSGVIDAKKRKYFKKEVTDCVNAAGLKKKLSKTLTEKYTLNLAKWKSLVTNRKCKWERGLKGGLELVDK